MRKVFIDCRCRKTAWRRASWAAAIAKCYGGFLAFESADDYYMWKRQR